MTGLRLAGAAHFPMRVSRGGGGWRGNWGAAVPIASLATPSRILGRPGKVVAQLQGTPPASYQRPRGPALGPNPHRVGSKSTRTQSRSANSGSPSARAPLSWEHKQETAAQAQQEAQPHKKKIRAEGKGRAPSARNDEQKRPSCPLSCGGVETHKTPRHFTPPTPTDWRPLTHALPVAHMNTHRGRRHPRSLLPQRSPGANRRAYDTRARGRREPDYASPATHV